MRHLRCHLLEGEDVQQGQGKVRLKLEIRITATFDCSCRRRRPGINSRVGRDTFTSKSLTPALRKQERFDERTLCWRSFMLQSKVSPVSM
jgi:hypothetical protein